jgi:putative ABC transport system substrate-binding protein
LLFLFLLGLALALSACSQQDSPSSVSTPENSGVSDEQAAASPKAPQDVSVPEIEWFTPSEEVVAYWQVLHDSQSPIQVSFEPYSGSADSRVLFLYTRTHPDYDIAVGTTLNSLREQGLSVEATVYFAEDDVAGFEALAYAEQNQFDLIFSVGSSTTAFLFENYSGRPIPVVTLLSKDPVLLGQMSNYTDGSGSNMAFTSVGIPVELQMNYFGELVPNLTNIVIIYAQENASTVLTQVEPLDKYSATAGLNLVHVAILNRDDPEQTRAELEEKLPLAIEELYQLDPEMKESIVLVTSSGSITKQFDTVNELAGLVPVVSLFPDLVRDGDSSAVLSVGVSFGSNSLQAGLYGARILRGDVQPGDLPVGVISPPDIAISFAKARQIGLKIPFSFFESATFVYNPDGLLVRDKGQVINIP